MILSELGIDLAPLLAGAGMLGVALGFGAQSVVRDFLSGMFMLLEDQYGVGDVIDAGDASGTVEGVSLRTTRLRDVEGVVWHVPNGEIKRVGNKSQQWSRAVLDVPVAFETDIEHAKRVIKETADAVWRRAPWSTMILGEPEVWGVEELGAQGVVIRLVVKTHPLEQWKVARELRARSSRRSITPASACRRRRPHRPTGPPGPATRFGDPMSGPVIVLVFVGIFLLAAVLIALGLGLSRRSGGTTAPPAPKAPPAPRPPAAPAPAPAVEVEAPPAEPVAPPEAVAPREKVRLRDRLGKTRAVFAGYFGAHRPRRHRRRDLGRARGGAHPRRRRACPRRPRLLDDLRERAAAAKVTTPRRAARPAQGRARRRSRRRRPGAARRRPASPTSGCSSA